MRKRKGFTLIELLVVIAIIGLLSTLAVVSLNSARQKGRDAIRVSDVKQITTALEMYYQDAGSYPTDADGATLGDATHECIDSDGFAAATCDGATVYMDAIPADPGSNAYTYTSAAGADYTIDFDLESGAAGLDGTDCQATETGITCTTPS